jgi:hypothetical protein
MKHEKDLSRQKSTKVNKSQQKSAQVDKNQQKSAHVGNSRPKSAEVDIMQLHQEQRAWNTGRLSATDTTYWNIKGCGDAARFFTGNSLFYREKACVDFCRKCGTNVPPLGMGARYGKNGFPPPKHAPLRVVPMWYHNLFEVVLLKTHET